MTRTRILVVTALVMALAVAGAAGWLYYRRVLGLDRRNRETAPQIQQQIVALDTERAALRAKLETLLVRDPRLDGMPDTPVRVGVPTTLARDLIARTIAGLVERIRIELRDIRVRRTGTVKRVVTLGDYDLTLTVTRVRATLKPGRPTVTFGANRVALAVPLTLGGTGGADVDFLWDGRRLGGAVCGDMHVTQSVTGTVVPRTYPVAGAVQFTTSDTAILARPRVPRLKLHVDVAPSEAAWASLRQILDEKRGLCGFVLDRVDIIGAVQKLIGRGFDVTVPTDGVKPMTLPIFVSPTMTVRGQPVELGIRLSGFAITEHMIWLGATIALDAEALPVPPLRRSPARTDVR
jgi:hypothetical protein